MDRHVDEQTAGALDVRRRRWLGSRLVIRTGAERADLARATASCTARWAGSKRRLNPTCRDPPGASPLSAGSTSARSRVIGFSQKIAKPPSRRRRSARRGYPWSCRSPPRRRRLRARRSPSATRGRRAGTDRVGQRRDDVVHAGELHAVGRVGEQFGVHPADAAASEHPDSHRFRAPAAGRPWPARAPRGVADRRTLAGLGDADLPPCAALGPRGDRHR